MRINELIHIETKNTLNESCTFTELFETFEYTDLDFIAITDFSGEFLGAIYRADFEQIDSETFDLESLLKTHFVYDYYHILETIREFLKCETTQLPVVDEENFYIGTIKQEIVQYHLNRTLGLIEGGSLISIQTTVQNYSLVDVARIVESNQAKILTHYVSTHPDSQNIRATLVLNISDINDIIATFERFDYSVIYTSVATERDDFLKERYDSLMHFLDI